MAMNDPLGDMLTRIRNAQMRKRGKVTTPGSSLRKKVLDVLESEGYIRGYSTTDYGNGRSEFEIELKYFDNEPVIRKIERVSKPGRRVYATVDAMPRVSNGLGVAIVRRRWLVLTLLPFMVVLAGMYIVIFADPRYRLPITLLVFPFAAGGLVWLGQTARDVLRERRVSRAIRWEAGLSLGLIITIFVGASTLAWAGGKLREHHRWAVQVCHVDQQARVCSWRSTGSRADGTPAVRGVWNSVGLAIPAAAPDRARETAAETELDLPPGDYAIEALLDIAPLDASTNIWSGEFSMQIGTEVSATVSLASIAQATRESSPLPLRIEIHHGGGKLPVRVRIAVPPGVPPTPLPGRLWVNEIAVTQSSLRVRVMSDQPQGPLR